MVQRWLVAFLAVALAGQSSQFSSFGTSTTVGQREKPKPIITTDMREHRSSSEQQPQNIASSTEQQQSLTTSTAPTMKSFYRRPLPNSCVAFSSRRGRSYLESAMRHHGLKSFFVLTEQHSTQVEPAYCGISTLVIALNALAVDPRQTWKGPWRWYQESMLNCCVDLEQIKQTGITLSVFNCLAICQGLETHLVYADASSSSSTLSSSSIETFRHAVRDACVETETAIAISEDNDTEETTVDRVLIASYNRKILGQTGSGHFSPIAAYDSVSDSVLILDTARFKYGAHWVPLPLLWEAMQPIDPDTGRSRGFVLLTHNNKQHQNNGAESNTTEHNLPISVLLRTEMKQNKARRVFKQFLEDKRNGGDSSKNYGSSIISYKQVEQFCTKDGSVPFFVWEMTSPHFKPFEGNDETNQLINETRMLIRELLPPSAAAVAQTSNEAAAMECHIPSNISSSTATPTCRRNLCRTLQLRPEEAVFIVYLACLTPEQRRQRVMGDGDDDDDTSSSSSTAKITMRARRQLLDEAELMWYAIDVSDQI